MATALQNTDRISVVVETSIIRAGRKLGVVRPDTNGYYTIPIAVLGTPTDNKTYYDVEEFVGQLQDPTSFINMVLTDGKLYGEYGHPPIQLMDEKLVLQRLCMIDEKSVSHHISKIWTGETLASGGKILYALIKPHGPYAEPLRNNLDDPCTNTSFSLRSVTKSRNENGLTKRKMQRLITFDYVTAGGYNEASKRFSPGVETFCDVSLLDNSFKVTEAAMECFSSSEINDILGATEITVMGTKTTFYDKKSALKDESGNLHSVFTSLLRRK